MNMSVLNLQEIREKLLHSSVFLYRIHKWSRPVTPVMNSPSSQGEDRITAALAKLIWSLRAIQKRLYSN